MSQHLGPLIGAIDQGTSSTRFLVFAANTRKLITSHQIEVKKIYPHEEWVEQDANFIIESVHQTIAKAIENLKEQNIDYHDIKCIGLSNQRETTVVWDKTTGKPFYNAIVWLDNRTKNLVDSILDSLPGRDMNWFKSKTGLPISTYFSALKIKWLIDNVDGVKDAIKSNNLLFGTIDSWILWNLTGNHFTDVTNASRTLLMDIETLQWDESLCKFFGIPLKILPTIKSCSDDFGIINVGPFKGFPITGVIGDQSAALVGQNCLSLGDTKATYGTGCFLMQNIGPGPLHGALSGIPKSAKRSLLITVGYKLKDGPTYYAMEGSIAIAGAAITWLRDNLNVINNYEEVDELAEKVENSGGVFFVPAFQGLYAPYWDPNATGLLIGLSQFTRKEHLILATLEGIAFQTVDILSIMRRDHPIVYIDGGMSKSNLLSQNLSDLTGCEIVKPAMVESTALGAAMIAGFSLHLLEFKKLRKQDSILEDDKLNESRHRSNSIIERFADQIGKRVRHFSSSSTSSRDIYPEESEVFKPSIDDLLREEKMSKWKEAVSRSRKWTKIEMEEQKREDYKRLSTLPFGLFAILSVGTIILSRYY